MTLGTRCILFQNIFFDKSKSLRLVRKRGKRYSSYVCLVPFSGGGEAESGGGVLSGSRSLDAISDLGQKSSFPDLFSELAARILIAVKPAKPKLGSCQNSKISMC